MQAIVMLGHGTKDAEGVAEFLGYAEGLRRRSGVWVTAGVLEYPTAELPPIQEAFDRAVAAGASEIVALPILLFFAGHTRHDIPREVLAAQSRHPNVGISVAGPLAIDDRLLSAVEDRLRPFGQDADSAVLLVGRGSLNSEANADLHKTARMLWDRNGYGAVEASFISVALPGVPAGIERCVRLGARRVVVMPYFLNTGVLVKRIATQAHHPAVDVRVAGHLGLHENVFEVLLQRVDQARSGDCPCRAATGCRIPQLSCSKGLACLAPA